MTKEDAEQLQNELGNGGGSGFSSTFNGASAQTQQKMKNLILSKVKTEKMTA